MYSPLGKQTTAAMWGLPLGLCSGQPAITTVLLPTAAAVRAAKVASSRGMASWLSSASS